MSKCISVEGSPGFQCNGGDVTVAQSEGSADITTPNVIVHCHGVLIARFGYPNDEALAADSLYAAGLKFYDVVEPLLGQKIPLPASVAALLGKQKQSKKMEARYSELKDFLLSFR